MAEKKSLEYLNKLHSKIVRSPFAKNVTEQEMLALIEGKKTLEEVQQYRALGMTPEQVKEMQIEYCVKSTILEEYKALGTVEELRVARDKQIEKKPKRHPGNEKLNYCPSCGLYYGGLRGFEYCSDCGQKLNWKEV